MTDAVGTWVGFEYAPDTPALDNHQKPIKRLSPANMPKTGNPHIVWPLQDEGRRVVYTESIHKANLVCDALQAPAVGIMGSGWSSTSKT